MDDDRKFASYVEDPGDACADNLDELEDASGDAKLLRDQDRFLPIANVAKVMKKSVPKSGKIAKDAKECVQECVSEFISFVTSEASERCASEKRKTINGEDILVALKTLGFDNYFEPLKVFLTKYRELNQNIRGDQKMGMVDGPLMDLVVEDDGFSDPLAGIMNNTDQVNRTSMVYTTSSMPGNPTSNS